MGNKKLPVGSRPKKNLTATRLNKDLTTAVKIKKGTPRVAIESLESLKKYQIKKSTTNCTSPSVWEVILLDHKKNSGKDAKLGITSCPLGVIMLLVLSSVWKNTTFSQKLY